MTGRSAMPDLLPILRSRTQADVLVRLLLGEPQPHTVADLAETLGADPWSVRRELQRLERAGIVEREAVGRSLRYHVDAASPLVEPLRILLERSVGADRMIADALQRVPGIDAAVMYGSWARGDVGPASDIDVLVIGSVDYGQLVDALAGVERRTGREVDLTAMTAEELEAGRRDGSGFLRDVFARPHQVLIGDDP